MDVLFGGAGGQSDGGSGSGSGSSSSSSSSTDGGGASAAASVAAASAARAGTSVLTSASGPAAMSQPVYSSSSATEATAGLEAASILVNPAHFNGHDNGPILYTDPNRTSAIDDIRSVVIYIFIVTIFLCFFLILPGIRNEKLPTFFCITTSLLVGSIIVLSLFGTTWHVGEAPISAAYKAFSRDRIQGDLKVRMGLQSVNISLKAHKYYILHHSEGPVIMENMSPASMLASITAASSAMRTASSGDSSAAPREGDNFVEYATSDQQTSASAAPSFINYRRETKETELRDESTRASGRANESSLTDELVNGRTSDGIPDDTELDTDEVFSTSSAASQGATSSRSPSRKKRQQQPTVRFKNQTRPVASGELIPNYTIKRVHVDINYNERFYWIGPVQMRHEYQQALERGLPYPILTVVEYLSQDEAGFNWSRRYRAAGYYTSMCLWLSASLCILMFCLHCAAPKYGIYAMQLLGCLLLLTNLTYATLVPRGDQKLVIPFEGQSLTFRFGWNFWLVLVGGCLSLLVGTIIVILDYLFPNFIFTTVLDADFDSHQSYHQRKHKTILHADRPGAQLDVSGGRPHDKPKFPPFMKRKLSSSASSSASSLALSSLSKGPTNTNTKDTSTRNSNLNQKSQATRRLAVENMEESAQIEPNGFGPDSVSREPSEMATSEKDKYSAGKTLRRRSEHQVTISSKATSQLAPTNSDAIDHRNIDSREQLEREQAIRL